VDILPDARKWKDAIIVLDVSDLTGVPRVSLAANAPDQKVICYVDRSPAAALPGKR